MQEDLSDIINFISLQESKKKPKNILSKDDGDDGDDGDDTTVADGINLLSPVKVDGEPSADIQTGPLTDLAKRKYTAQQASKGVGSIHSGTSGVVGFASSPSISMTRSGFANPLGRSIADVVAAGRLQQRLAASYDPFQNGQENLSENVKLIRKKVLSLLAKEPHKTKINKMRQELNGE